VYWPLIGRFVSADSYSGRIEDPASLNRYSYVRNNPYKYTDPTGHYFESPIDVAFIVFDLLSMAYHSAKGDTQAMLIDSAALSVDLACLATPVATGGGLAVRAGAEVKLFWSGSKQANQAMVKAEQLGTGRTGAQTRLKEIADDWTTSTADRGWIKQEQNAIDRGTRTSIRNPPGKELSHSRGREAAKGYDHAESPSNLQDKSLHRTQHKFDRGGRANKERP
jgi:hypothetical protein